MKNDTSLINSGRTNFTSREVENNARIETPPPPPPPRMKSKQAQEITTSIEGRQFRNGIELFDKNSIREQSEKSINTKFQARQKELYAAIGENDVAAVKKLLERDPDLITAFHKNGSSLLLYALREGNLRIAELLIKAGAVRYSSKIHITKILVAAIINEDLEIAKLLILEGADLNPDIEKNVLPPLGFALSKNYFEFASYLIKNGSNVNYKLSNGFTLFHNECAGDANPKIIEFLIDNGANTCAQSTDGTTPLMTAAFFDNIELTEILLKKNTKNINVENQLGGTALIYAAQLGHSEIVSLLIESGARVDRLNNENVSALFYACRDNHAEVLDILLDGLGGADLNEINFLVQFRLAEIIREGKSKVLSVLLNRGLRVNAFDHEIWSHLEQAARNGHTDVIRIILENFSSSLPLSKPGLLSRTPALVFEYLNSALRGAAQGGYEEIARMLIGAGAKPDVLDTNGESALSLAIKNGHLKTILLLFQSNIKLTHRKENGKISDELLWALDRLEPDPLTIDILLDFENEITMKHGSISYTVRFNELCNKVHNLIAASRTGKIDQNILLDLNASLCTDFDFSYLNAKTLANMIQHISTIYSPSTSSGAIPTAKQLRMSFVESISGNQRLHDLIRHDDEPAKTHYESYDEAPEFAEKLIHRASAQAGFIVLSADAELKEQQDTLSDFLKNITPAITRKQAQEFMQEEGWHPLLSELVADSWESMKQNRTSQRLFKEIRDKLNDTEFGPKVEQLPSDAARHLLTQQMNRLTGIINT